MITTQAISSTKMTLQTLISNQKQLKNDRGSQKQSWHQKRSFEKFEKSISLFNVLRCTIILVLVLIMFSAPVLSE
jgi:hypothetical protein